MPYPPSSPARFPILLGFALTLASCIGTQPSESVIYAAPGRTIYVTMGQDLALTLQTIGPGDYDATPEISGPALAFLDVSTIGTHPRGRR